MNTVTNQTSRTAALRFVNNTGHDLRDFDTAFAEAALNGGKLCEELADLFTLTLATSGAWIINWA